jgi:HAD superfamily hydrolase (TIGR01458 family)
MNKGLIIDLEGTLVNSGMPLPNSIEFINYLNKNNIRYYIVTNTVSKTTEKWETILKGIGLNIKKDKIINPITVLNEFIKENNIKKFLFIGADDIKILLQESLEYISPEYIVFCDFENIELSYELFNKIFQYIRNGSKIIATSYSNYYISKNEYKMDIGIFVKMYEILTNEKAIIMGKPSQNIYKMAIRKLEMDVNSIITIGDDGLTDIIGGNEIGIETVLIKTGKYKNGDEEIYKPKKTINNIMEIINEINEKAQTCT